MMRPADRLRDHLLRAVASYDGDGMRAAPTATEAVAALSARDDSFGPDWFRVLVLVRFLDAPGIREVLERELSEPHPDRSFHAALLLALLGSASGLRLLERPPPLSSSGIEIGRALLARAALGKLDERELEKRLDQAPNARAFGL